MCRQYCKVTEQNNNYKESIRPVEFTKIILLNRKDNPHWLKHFLEDTYISLRLAVENQNWFIRLL